MIDSLEFVLQNEPWSADVFAKRADVTYSFDNFCDALVSWLGAHENKNDVSHGHLGKPSTDRLGMMFAKSRILDFLYGEYSTPRYADRRSFHQGNRFHSAFRLCRKKVCIKNVTSQATGKHIVVNLCPFLIWVLSRNAYAQRDQRRVCYMRLVQRWMQLLARLLRAHNKTTR
jgi:hypothetical protein